MNFFVFLFFAFNTSKKPKSQRKTKVNRASKSQKPARGKMPTEANKKNNANQRPPGFLVGKEGIKQGRKEVIKEGKEEGRNEGRMASCAGTVPKSGRGGAAPSPLKSGTFYTTVGTARASF